MTTPSRHHKFFCVCRGGGIMDPAVKICLKYWVGMHFLLEWQWSIKASGKGKGCHLASLSSTIKVQVSFIYIVSGSTSDFICCFNMSSFSQEVDFNSKLRSNKILLDSNWKQTFFSDKTRLSCFNVKTNCFISR